MHSLTLTLTYLLIMPNPLNLNTTYLLSKLICYNHFNQFIYRTRKIKQKMIFFFLSKRVRNIFNITIKILSTTELCLEFKFLLHKSEIYLYELGHF